MASNYGNYPYGQFPTNYTINGQNKLKEKLNRPQENTVSIASESTANVSQTQGISPNLYPLLLKMMDKSISESDIINTLMPKDSNLAPFVNLITASKKAKKNPPTTLGEIETLQRIDKKQG